MVNNNLNTFFYTTKSELNEKNNENIFLDSDNIELKDIFIDTKINNKNLFLSFNPKTEQSKLILSNPFNLGGREEIGILVGNDGFLNNSKLTTYYQDIGGNRISCSRSAENPIGFNSRNSIFKIDETSLSYSFSLFKQSLSIVSSDCSILVGEKNNNKIHKANTGNSYKTSIQHLCKIIDNKYNKLFCRVHSEVSIPFLSSCSLFKSQFHFTKIFNFSGVKLRFDGSIGGIINLNKKKTILPINERFFNGKNYGFPGFFKSSISDRFAGASYLGSTSYFAFRTTLFKEISKQISGILYFNIGNFNLSLFNKNSNFFKLNNIRSSAGVGFSFDMGNSLIMFSAVKPINYYSKDKLKNFSFEMLYKS